MFHLFLVLSFLPLVFTLCLLYTLSMIFFRVTRTKSDATRHFLLQLFVSDWYHLRSV